MIWARRRTVCLSRSRLSCRTFLVLLWLQDRFTASGGVLVCHRPDSSGRGLSAGVLRLWFAAIRYVSKNMEIVYSFYLFVSLKCTNTCIPWCDLKALRSYHHLIALPLLFTLQALVFAFQWYLPPTVPSPASSRSQLNNKFVWSYNHLM